MRRSAAKTPTLSNRLWRLPARCGMAICGKWSPRLFEGEEARLVPESAQPSEHSTHRIGLRQPRIAVVARLHVQIPPVVTELDHGKAQGFYGRIGSELKRGDLVYVSIPQRTESPIESTPS